MASTSNGMLINAPKRFYQLQRLHVYDEGKRNSYTGIRATMFGGSSPLGALTGSMLTRMGSQCIYPYRNLGSNFNNRIRDLKTTADVGYRAFVRLTDFTSERETAMVMKNSNVVINLIGNKMYHKTEEDFETANIRIPLAIAKSVKNNPNVKRFIMVSAAGADPNSHSKALRTKWLGEQEVKDIYPEVTIIRPTMMYNILEPNPSIAGKWQFYMKMFNRMNFVVENMNENVQPVYANDVAQAILNCLKMEETIGQTYELGGNNTYSYEEIYEMFFNITMLKPYSVQVKLEDVYEQYYKPWWGSFYRQLFRQYLFPEAMTAEAKELIVQEGAKTFEDLCIKPISFGHKAHELVNEIYWLWNANDRSKRENANN